MTRRVRNFCGLCHKQIYDNEQHVLESDLRGVVRRIYHRKCVMTQSNGEAKE